MPSFVESCIQMEFPRQFRSPPDLFHANEPLPMNDTPQQTHAESPNGIVYILRESPELTHATAPSGKEFIKIGKASGTVETRIKQLQTGNPRRIESVQCFKTPNQQIAHDVEGYLHSTFNRSRVAGGEWFMLDQDQVNQACTLAPAACMRYTERERGVTSFQSVLQIGDQRQPSQEELSRMDVVRHELLIPIRDLAHTQSSAKVYLRLMHLKRNLKAGMTKDSAGASGIGTGPVETPQQPPRVVTTTRAASLHFNARGFQACHRDLAMPFLQLSRSFHFEMSGVTLKRNTPHKTRDLTADLELAETKAIDALRTGHAVGAVIDQLDRALDGRTENDVHSTNLDATRETAQFKYELIEQELWFMDRLGGYSEIDRVCTGKWKTSIKRELKEFVQHNHPDLYQQFLVPVAGSTSITSPRGGIVPAPAWVPEAPRG